MMLRTGCLFIFMLAAVSLRAQDSTMSDYGPVKVTKDSRIDILIKKQIYINTLAIRNQPGFRVQVITTNSRNDAYNAKAKAMQLFPEFRSYIDFQAPYFKVRIGDFSTREEATELRNKLLDQFSGGVFVVPTIINVTPGNEFE